jgi:hypothetical protein
MGKYTKDQTTLGPSQRPKGEKVSNFLITVNVNKVSPKEGEVYEGLKRSYEQLGDFLLKKKTIDSYLKFVGDSGEEGDYITDPAEIRKRKRLINSIEDRSAAIEYGETIRRVHLHATLTVKHFTKVHLDVPSITEIARVFFPEVKPTSVHVNVRGMKANAFLNYVKKYNMQIPEDNE